VLFVMARPRPQVDAAVLSGELPANAGAATTANWP
jgi:hypothetical protein